MGASSNAVFYARGGTKYDVYVAKGCTPIIRTASYSVNGETVQPIAYNADYVPISIRQQLSADKLDKTATAVAAKNLQLNKHLSPMIQILFSITKINRRHFLIMVAVNFSRSMRLA
ncbi:hypothetical protein DKC18_015020 [Acinetobacter nosocomialis]|nr:hypothetical protein DKC18_015020 [Acinetobacter nosocomialis]